MACLWAGLHALVDFNLQIPAISLTFISLLGLLAVTSDIKHARK